MLASRLNLKPLLLAIALTVPAGAWSSEPLDKVGLHAQMQVLQSQIDTLKGQSSAQAQQQYAELRAQLMQISASLGGDLPASSGTASAGSSAVRAAPPSPPNCTASASTFTESTPVAIPAGPAVITSTLVVTGAGTYLWDVDVTTFITHTFAGDIDMTIQSPAGTVVTLTTDNGAGNDDVFNGTVWDDSANPGGQVPYVTNNGLVTDHVYANLVLASPLVPEEALAAFVGEDPNGTWTLTISDDAAGDAGTLNSWSLALTTFASAPINEPVQSFNQTTPVAIPAGPAVVTSTLVASGLTAPICGAIARTNMPHTFAGDLDVTLSSPAGTVVTLTTDNGAGNDDVFAGTVWNDKANPGGQVPYVTNNGIVTDHVYANLTLASPLVPEEAMGAFMGEDGNGTWTLTVSDDAGGDAGTLVDWGVDLVTCTCGLPASSDVSLTATDAPDPVAPGGNLTYTLTVTNNGPDAADDVSLATTTPADTTFVSVSAPGLTCLSPAVGGTGPVNCNTAAPTAASAQYVATLVVAVDATALDGSTLTLVANASTTTADPDQGNNIVTVTTTVQAGGGTGTPAVALPSLDRAALLLLGLMLLLAGAFAFRHARR